MKRLAQFGLMTLFLLAFSACKNETTVDETQKQEVKRIVSLSGSITEILYALDAANELVGVDVTSTFPAEAEKLPNLGHVRKLEMESLLATNPTHVLMLKDEVVPDLKEKLEKAGVKLVVFHHPMDIPGAKNLIIDVATWLDKKEGAEKLIQKMDTDLKKVARFDVKPKVLFVYARGAGMLMVAGEKTPLASIIELAGGENAGTGFTDFKPLTSESVVAANPDVILMFTSGAQSLGPDGIFNVPGVSVTNSGKNHAMIEMDGQFLSGFGPRAGEAILELNQQLSKLK